MYIIGKKNPYYQDKMQLPSFDVINQHFVYSIMENSYQIFLS